MQNLCSCSLFIMLDYVSVHCCLCINYVTYHIAYLWPKVWETYVETFIAFWYLCKYYSKSFHSLDIATCTCTYLLSQRKFCFSCLPLTVKIAKHAQLHPIIIFVNYMYYTRLKFVRGIRGFCAQTVHLSRPLFVKKLTEKTKHGYQLLFCVCPCCRLSHRLSNLKVMYLDHAYK